MYEYLGRDAKTRLLPSPRRDVARRATRLRVDDHQRGVPLSAQQLRLQPRHALLAHEEALVAERQLALAAALAQVLLAEAGDTGWRRLAVRLGQLAVEQRGLSAGALDIEGGVDDVAEVKRARSRQRSREEVAGDERGNDGVGSVWQLAPMSGAGTLHYVVTLNSGKAK